MASLRHLCLPHVHSCLEIVFCLYDGVKYSWGKIAVEAAHIIPS